MTPEDKPKPIYTPEPQASKSKIETYDEQRGVGILSDKPPTAPQGPRRHAPAYYAGKTHGRKTSGPNKGRRRRMLYPDTEVFRNGAVGGIRDKAARRIIRNAFDRAPSKVEQGLQLARAMKAQAREIAKEQGKSTRWARRLFERELAIHTTVYAPNQKELRAMRTAARKVKRAGGGDAISKLVDRMSGEKPRP